MSSKIRMRESINTLASRELTWWNEYKVDWKLALGMHYHSPKKIKVDLEMPDHDCHHKKATLSQK